MVAAHQPRVSKTKEKDNCSSVLWVKPFGPIVTCALLFKFISLLYAPVRDKLPDADQVPRVESARIKNSLSLINKFSDLPVAVGFGITTKKQISEISEIADAAVVGSHIVKFIENSYSEHNSLDDSTVLNIQNEVKHLSSGIKILE